MEGAKVNSVDALRSFRAALVKFADSANSAVTDADADVRSTLMWLERDQIIYWQSQIRKRHEALSRAQEALRHKQLFKAPHGGRASVVDEQKMVTRCKAALEEAEQKLVNVKKSIQRLNKQMMEFQGQIQRLASTVQLDIPNAVAELDRMVGLLDEYVAMSSRSAAPGAAAEDQGGVGRGAPAEEGVGGIDWKRCRRMTPPPSARAAAPAGLVGFGPWKIGEIKVDQQEMLQAIALPVDPPAAEERVVLARDVADAKFVFLERLTPAFPGDSGWFIGATAEGTVSDCIALNVAEIIAMRQDFARILTLPRGTLVGMDEHGIAALLDAADAERWSRPVSPIAPALENPATE